MVSWLVALLVAGQAGAASPPKGVRLERMVSPDVQTVLRPETVVVLPLGAAAVEHGPHLRLSTDAALAEYVTQRVVEVSAVVVAPALPYHYYPAFAEYPGSTTLTMGTARDLTSEIVRSLARFGPRRFYVINTGVSTVQALQAAATALAADGILLQFTDFAGRLASISPTVRRQEREIHAENVETSMMLYIDASAVDVKSAIDMGGNPTRANGEKGRVMTEALVAAVLEDINVLRTAPLPPMSRREPPRPMMPSAPSDRASASRPECTPGDERAIRQISDAFAVAWANQDYERLGGLWTTEGDIVHPDGWIERGARVITENRRELFTRREYRHSRHPLSLARVRCVTGDVAVADGKWELRGVTDGNGKVVPTSEGLVTVVFRRDGGWRIEAYRYTIKPPSANTPPILLKRPGFPGGK